MPGSGLPGNQAVDQIQSGLGRSKRKTARASLTSLTPRSTDPTVSFFPSNAFMASARSLHTLKRGKQVNCSLHAGLSICRKPQKCRLWTSTQSRNCPSKRTNKKRNQKQQSKNSKKHTTKTKTKQKRQRWDRNQQWELLA